MQLEHIQVGNWDIEVCEPVPPASIHTGSCFIASAAALAQAACMTAQPVKKARVVSSGAALAPAHKPRVELKNLEGELVLQEAAEGSNAGPVYVPAFLAKKLRPHQEQGVRFLFNVCAASQMP